MSIRNRIIRWLGGEPRSPKQPRDERGWNEDWQVGDWAECVQDDWENMLDNCHPRVGDVLRVSQLCEDVATHGQNKGALASFLRFSNKPQNRGWHCAKFRKLRPCDAAEITDKAVLARIKQAGKVKV